MPFYPVQNPDIKKTSTIGTVFISNLISNVWLWFYWYFTGGEPNDTISIKPPDYFSKEMYVSSSELESYLTDSHSTSCSERNGPTPSMISSNFTLHQHIQYYEPDITSPAAAGSHVPTTRSLVKKKRKNPQRGKRAVASITGEIDSTMSVPCFSLQSTAPTLKPIGNLMLNKLNHFMISYFDWRCILGYWELPSSSIQIRYSAGRADPTQIPSQISWSWICCGLWYSQRKERSHYWTKQCSGNNISIQVLSCRIFQQYKKIAVQSF